MQIVHEGAFYVWTPEAINTLLGDEDGAWACNLLHVTPSGTFEEGLSTLQLLADPDDQDRWIHIRRALFMARELRPRPQLDDKIVASWNGLAIAALAEAGMLFGQSAWIAAAESAAELLVDVHLGHHGANQLNRTSRNGVAGSNWGVLDDYANVAEGLLALYQVTANERWFDLASNLLDLATKNFADGSNGYFYTDAAAPGLVQRPKSIFDNAEPSGWFALAKVLITHSALTGSTEYRALAESALAPVRKMADTSPMSIGWGLVAAQSLLCGPEQAVIIGTDTDERRDQFVREAWKSSKPGSVIVFGGPNAKTSVPLLWDRPMLGDGPTAYLCREFICEQPTNDQTAFQEQLNT
jgi:uncharacterized protein YyaL (SSP411 family)